MEKYIISEAFNQLSKSKRLNEDAYSAYYDYQENSYLDKLYDRLEKAAAFYNLYPEVNVQNGEGAITFMDENNGYEIVHEIDVHEMDDVLYELGTIAKLKKWIKEVVIDKKENPVKRYHVSRNRFNKLSTPEYDGYFDDDELTWFSRNDLVKLIISVVKKHQSNPEVNKIIEEQQNKLFDPFNILKLTTDELNNPNITWWIIHQFYHKGPNVLKSEINRWLLNHIPQDLIEPE